MDWLVGVVDPESETFHETVELRYRELREPLGLDFTPEQIAEDAKQTTIAISDGEQVRGVLLVQHIDNETAKIRQVAVDQAYQGQGLGRKMSLYAEQFIQNCGYKSILIHARKVAKPFYDKMAYTTISEEFEEVGIPHYKMSKTL